MVSAYWWTGGIAVCIFLLTNPQVSLAIAGVLVGMVLLVSGLFTMAFGFQLHREVKKIDKALAGK